MIDFRNASAIPRRITKHTVSEGDFYTKSITAFEKEQIYENNKKASEEELIVIVIGKILCDEQGKELMLTIEELKNLPDALFKDITKACMGLALGEKKS